MEFMTYKGYPLVRKGSEIYYGYMSDPFVIWMNVEESDKSGKIPVSKKIKFYQMSTDDTLDPGQRIVKNGARDTLYDALAVSYTWLERANQK